jgi:hypothetical protein
MPEYSITIKLNGRNPVEIVRMLEAVFGSGVAQEAKIVDWGQPNYYDDPCRTMGHFGCVHWTDEDVEGRFQELDVPITPTLLKGVKDKIRHIDDGMTEVGWEVIESAILDAADAESRSQ